MNRRAFLARVALADLPAPCEVRFKDARKPGSREVWMTFDSTADALKWAAEIGAEYGTYLNSGDGNTYLDGGSGAARWQGGDVYLWACDHPSVQKTLPGQLRQDLEAMTADE